jgi:hypothetical protein
MVLYLDLKRGNGMKIYRTATVDDTLRASMMWAKERIKKAGDRGGSYGVTSGPLRLVIQSSHLHAEIILCYLPTTSPAVGFPGC